METWTLTAPCHFGLESVLKREIYDLGYDITQVRDGEVSFTGDAEAVARANIWLRTAERLLLEVGRVNARTYDELFENVKALPWEAFIPLHGKFWVTKASAVNCQLYSPSDIQSIVKKAIVERLKEKYHTAWFPEDGEEYPIRVRGRKNEFAICLDTSGPSLHKRGYRTEAGGAPISETLAAALIGLTRFKRGRILVDPFCGSGTFLIEAALMAANRAPGLTRDFTAEKWTGLIPKNCFTDAVEEAGDLEDLSDMGDLQGYDIDADVLRYARANAARAGVDSFIHFQQRDVAELHHAKKYGFIITNPPYGERMGSEDELAGLYRTLGSRFAALDSWSCYVITPYADIEKAFGRKATKNRKVYNGMIRTYFYSFEGPKPVHK